MPPKNLLLMPFRVALALQADGWWLRSAITWCKAAPMPESVTDRPTSATEMVFLLSKSAKYFYDADAVREPLTEKSLSHRGGGNAAGNPNSQDASGRVASGNWGAWDRPRIPGENGRNLWNYLVLPPEPFAQAHFATFPTAIPRIAILAGTSQAGCCPTCLAPLTRVVERRDGAHESLERPKAAAYEEQGLVRYAGAKSTLSLSGDGSKEWAERGPRNVTTGWTPGCLCAPAEPIPCVVIDPFSGSGTTGLVASRLGRDYIGCELNPEYAAMSEARINSDEMLFSERVQVEAPAAFVPVPLFSEATA